MLIHSRLAGVDWSSMHRPKPFEVFALADCNDGLCQLPHHEWRPAPRVFIVLLSTFM